MANYTGAVRFPDGELKFFSYYGTCDAARRVLFDVPEAVTHQQDFLPAARAASDEESIDVMPYFEHGSNDVMFLSRASRSLGAITGPISLDEATRESDSNHGSPYSL